jgi:hypothetical protein
VTYVLQTSDAPESGEAERQQTGDRADSPKYDRAVESATKQ